MLNQKQRTWRTDTFPSPHNTLTHSHTFSISFCCTKGQWQRERMNSHSPGFCGLVGWVLSWFHLRSLKQLQAGRWPHLHVSCYLLLTEDNWVLLHVTSLHQSLRSTSFQTSHPMSEHGGYGSFEGIVPEVAETHQLHYVTSQQVTEPAQMANSFWKEVCNLGS